MGHEITSTDNVVLHKDRAWHGLGIIVADAPTPTEALRIAGLDWSVDQWPLVAVNEGGARMNVPSHVLNMRGDTQSRLGVVGANYQPIQNRELAEFAEALAKEGDIVRCESAGSIRGGQKVWFLLKGESFSVRHGDDVTSYICISNGHDGTAAMRCTPTTVRVVCSNTLHMVIPQDDRKIAGKMANGAFIIRHVGEVKVKIEEARRALRLYEHGLANTKGMMGTLAAADVTSDQLQAFWLDVYQRQFGAVAVNPITDKETRHREKALAAIGSVANNFDEDRTLTGASAWGAVNAYTKWMQHERNVPGKDDKARAERRLSENLFGENAERSTEVFSAAMAMITG